MIEGIAIVIGIDDALIDIIPDQLSIQRRNVQFGWINEPI
jgi:hypothetical protein